MKKLLFLSVLLFAAGCNKKADNSATRYGGALKDDTVKARAAAEKADAAVDDQNARMKEAETAGN